ncbi:MAG TPA: hypothetical protein P5079_08535 [Elusimicrobiota bacterium]|nr:hypothetical protein [Elusimicrobiota bacterium]
MDQINKLNEQINDLWEKMRKPSASSLPPSASADFLSAERDLLRQTIAHLRRHFDEEKDRWQKLLAERDEAVQGLKEEKRWLDEQAARQRQELAALHSNLQSQLEVAAFEKTELDAELVRRIRQHEDELRLYQQQQQNLEAGHRQEVDRLQAALNRWKEEEQTWHAMVEQKNQALAGLSQRINELELQRQKDRHEWDEGKRQLEKTHRDTAAQTEKEKTELKETLEVRDAEIENYKRLLQMSQEEIVDFTRVRHKLETELRAADEQIGRLQNEIANMREAWEVERGHWRELWERERASREKWYDNMREWEDHLRREREDWLTQFRTEQSSREATAKRMDAAVDRLGDTTARLVAPPPVTRAAASRRFAVSPVRVWGTAAVFVGLTALAVLLLRACGAPKEFNLPSPNISGLTVYGSDLWMSDWMNGRLLQASADRPDKATALGKPSATFHPVSLRRFEGSLWSLDPWTRTLQEHALLPPFVARRAWPVLASTPVDFCWDGQGVWILDGGAQILRRFPRGDFSVPDREVPLPADWKIIALDYADGAFWGYDKAAARLRRFVLSPTVSVSAEYRLPVHQQPGSPLTALSVHFNELWTASEKSQTLTRWSRWALRRHKIRS